MPFKYLVFFAKILANFYKSDSEIIITDINVIIVMY